MQVCVYVRRSTIPGSQTLPCSQRTASETKRRNGADDRPRIRRNALIATWATCLAISYLLSRDLYFFAHDNHTYQLAHCFKITSLHLPTRTHLIKRPDGAAVNDPRVNGCAVRVDARSVAMVSGVGLSTPDGPLWWIWIKYGLLGGPVQYLHV